MSQHLGTRPIGRPPVQSWRAVPAATRRSCRPSTLLAAASLGLDAADLAQRDLSGTVVVTGAGPAGLATAAALHRVGLPAVLLEREAGLSAAGSALGLWTNAWRALEALGAAEPLRSQHPQIQE